MDFEKLAASINALSIEDIQSTALDESQKSFLSGIMNVASFTGQLNSPVKAALEGLIQ